MVNFRSKITCNQKSTDWGYEVSSRKWNRGRKGLHQLGQPVVPSILFPGRRFISPVCIRMALVKKLQCSLLVSNLQSANRYARLTMFQITQFGNYISCERSLANIVVCVYASLIKVDHAHFEICSRTRMQNVTSVM